MLSPGQNVLSGEYTLLKSTIIVLGLFIQALGTFACGTQPPVSRLQGGTEVGNPPTAYRQIVGVVPGAADWEEDSSIQVPGDCLGSQVWAQVEHHTVAIGHVDFECHFSLWVESDSNYSFQLSLSSEAQIPVVFTAEDVGFSEELHVAASEEPIAWGQLSLALSDDQWVAVPNATDGEPAAVAPQLTLNQEASPFTIPESESEKELVRNEGVIIGILKELNIVDVEAVIESIDKKKLFLR